MEHHKFNSLGEMITTLVPTYKSRSWRPFVATFGWDVDDYDRVHEISARRCEKRVDSYMIPGELQRSTESIRFGREKLGHGFHKKRGDFCLVGGALKGTHLTVFYRRVELLGGLHYDLAVFNEVYRHKGPLRKITIMAAEACVFCVKGNSNEKLYSKLMRTYR